MGRNKELTEAQRGAILYCRKRGDKLCTIAETVGCGVTTVRDTLKRHAETGQTEPENGLEDLRLSIPLIAEGSNDW